MKRKGFIVLTSLLVLLGIALCVLNSPTFQRRLVREITQSFVDKSGSKLSIEQANINLFRGIVLHNVVLSDSLGVPFLKADRLEIGVRIIPLLKRRVELHALRIIKADIRLFRKTPDAPLNIQAFLSSFKSSQKKESNWQIQFRHIMIRESNISYDVVSEPSTAGKFDKNHLKIEQLSTLVRLNLSPHSISHTLTIVKLNASNCCGIPIKNLTGKVNLNEHHSSIQSLRIETAGSTLRCPEIAVSYPRWATAFTNLDALTFSPMVLNGHILPSEWAFLYPELADVVKPVSFSFSMQGSTNEWKIEHIRLSLEDRVQLEGNVAITHPLTPALLSLNGRIDLLKLTPKGIEFLYVLFAKQPSNLTVLHNLGVISYMGNVAYKNRMIDLKGEFTSAAGPLSTNASMTINRNKSLQFNGRLVTTGFNLARLSTTRSDLGMVAMDIALDGSQKRDSINGKIVGTVGLLEIGGYTYHNIALDGFFSNKHFQGRASLNDENAKLDANGLIDFSATNNHYLFDLSASQVNLHALHVLKKGTSSELAFKLQADFTGKTVEDVQGDVHVEGLTFSQNGKKVTIKDIKAKSVQNGQNSTLNVTSDVLDASIDGRFKLNQLNALFSQLVNQYVPSAFTLPPFKAPSLQSDIDLHATLYPSDSLASVLQIPLTYQQNINLDASYRYKTHKFRIRAAAPTITYNKTSFQSLNLLVENPLNELKCIAHAQTGNESSPMEIDVDIRALNDKAAYKFFWSNSGTETHTGTIQGDVRFSRNPTTGQPIVDVGVNPSEIILNDSTWRIHPASAQLNNGRIHVESFQLSHGDEFIRINGIASAQLNDTLSVSFNSFRLDEIIRLLPKGNFFVGGKITGKANCPHLLKNGTMDANLSVESFSMNNVVMGNLNASTQWNMNRRALELAGTLHSFAKENEPSRVLVTAAGDYFPYSDNLNIDIDAHQVNLRFLEPYLNTVVQNLNIVGSGKIRLIGPMKSIGIYANVYAEKSSFNIGLLNTTYSFSDSVFVTPTKISFNNIKVSDKEGNTGNASCMIRHNHFKDMRIQLNVDFNKMLVMDLPETPNALFYGTAYGSGKVSISGPQDNISLDVNMRTEDRTKVTISPMEATDDLDENFLQFVTFTKRYRQPTPVQPPIFRKEMQPTSLIKDPSNMTIDLQIEATPSAELTLITDPNTGDEIKSRGSGAIRAVFDDNSDINLFGRYTIENGSYKFIYENIIRRDFSIVRGSTINFSGDPFAAQLDITANHTVDAQLFDLIPSSELASLNLIKNSIPVNCVLKLGGELQRPDIKLDMGFPSADDELVRRIRSVINTEEQMNQQIVYLLLFGRFSTPSTNTNTGQSNVSSVLNTAISTLSSQVNSILNNAFGYSNLSFDVNYQNTAYETGLPGEFKVGVSGQWLDDRLTIQGNLGSRENLAQTGTSQFIGEFDLRLRMKNSEKWSWKLFNRANDNRYFKSALNTQGFGVVYNEEFNHPLELFRQLIETLKNPFVRKNANSLRTP